MKTVENSLFDEKDQQNFAVVEDLVRNHFALNPESFEYFKQQLRNPTLDDDIYDFFTSHQSSRVYFDLPLKTQEEFDNSWHTFKDCFYVFIEKTQCDYSHFKNNKIVIDKNEFKIPKALNHFYKKRMNEQKELLKEYLPKFIDFNQVKNQPAGDLGFNIRKIINGFKIVNAYVDIDIVCLNEIQYWIEDSRSSFESKEGIEEFLDYYYSNNISKLEDEIAYKWQSVSRDRLSKENLQLVLSFNYADFFLCSTKENWTSCLALDGGSANYWYGITGLIGDKNRIMAYITDGSQKSYRGIKTDRFIYRSWVLLGEDDKFRFNRWFPNEFKTKEISKFLTKNTSLKFSVKTLHDEENFITKYPLTPVYNLDGYMMFPYQDYAELRSDLHFVYGEGGLYYKLINSDEINVGELYSGDAFSCLGDLIENGSTIVDTECYAYRCEDCDDGIRQDETHFYIEPQGYIVCERCYDRNYFTCEYCGYDFHLDESYDANGHGLFCEHCFQDQFFFCEITETVHRIEEAVQVSDERNGKNIFLASEEAAVDNEYALNETDDVFYPKKFMVYIESQDQYVHIDEVEEGQLELEFEEAI